MITAWMLYAVVVGALLGAGALALEKVFRTHGLPSRWLWAGTILLAVLFPLGHLAWRSVPREVPVVAVAEPVVVVPSEVPQIPFPLEPAGVEVPRESVLRLMDRPILVAWALATGVLLLFGAFLLLRTRRLMARWRHGRVEGQHVLFSDEWGPAVVGFFRPQVVLPRWCQEVDVRAVRFILDHELEHVRAGDLRLLLVAGILPVLFPWHLPLWWQLSRLRTAVEGDCDLRVLRRNPGQMRPYVDLLLRVGEMNPGRRPIAAMLSEPYETLKRRIKIMTMPFPKRPWIRGGLLVGLGALMVGLACGAPGPTDAANDEPDPAVEGAPLVEPGTLSAEATDPVFTPYTVRPDVKNPDRVAAALERAYPASLKEAGVGGMVAVWFFVDEDGKVQNVQVNASSGHRELDDAAISIASLVEFTPALNRDQKVPVWVSLPIVFGPEGSQAASELEAAWRATRAEEMAPFRRRASESTEEADPQVPVQRGEIEGVAVDASSGTPLQFAQIVVAGTGYGTLTNHEGHFLLQRVPAGDHVVGAIRMGYGRVGKEVKVRAGQRASVDFDLRPQAVPLSPFVVAGEGDAAGQGDSAEDRAEPAPGRMAVKDLRVAPTGREGMVVVAGTVMDLNTEEPVGAVEVRIIELQKGTTTNTDGQFVLGGIPSGDHTVSTRHAELGEATARVVVARPPPLDLEAEALEAERAAERAASAPIESPAQLPGKDGAGTLWGTITEDGTGATVGGARVSLLDLETGAISNVHGKYLMFNVQPGTHTLLIEKEGFPPVEVEVVIEAGETTVVDPVIRR